MIVPVGGPGADFFQFGGGTALEVDIVLVVDAVLMVREEKRRRQRVNMFVFKKGMRLLLGYMYHGEQSLFSPD